MRDDVAAGKLFAQAMELINPPEKSRCRFAVFDAIWEIWSSKHLKTTKEVKEKLLEIAEHLKKAAQNMEVLPESIRLELLPRNTLEDLIFDPIRDDRRLGTFLYTLKSAADTAKRLAAETKVRRKGRAKLAKQVAAQRAWDLLKKFGQKPPTLTRNGTFPRLADTLYEAAMGERPNLWASCRTVKERQK